MVTIVQHPASDPLCFCPSTSACLPETLPMNYLDEVTPEQIGQLACHILKILLPFLSKEARTESDESVLYKIRNFFLFVSRLTSLNVTECISIASLISRFVETERDPLNLPQQRMVVYSNLGTILLCATILTIKMNRDHSFLNGWWAKALHIPLQIVNESEVVFLKRLDHDVSLTQSRFEAILPFLQL